mmetsp:Transcript_8663/g.13072  ORF Transcript_8663/g.13072 Transcript_8663/m.13072 type:complete len:131 (-) Transcript_8663:26-418(-)
MPRWRAVRIMRRVISPRLAMRILWNGGDDGVVDDVVVDDNGRFDDDDVTSMVCGSCADDSHRDETVDGLFLMPLQAVRKNNFDEDIVQIIYGCNFVCRTLNSMSDTMMAAERNRSAVSSSQFVHSRCYFM